MEPVYFKTWMSINLNNRPLKWIIKINRRLGFWISQVIRYLNSSKLRNSHSFRNISKCPHNKLISHQIICLLIWMCLLATNSKMRTLNQPLIQTHLDLDNSQANLVRLIHWLTTDFPINNPCKLTIKCSISLETICKLSKVRAPCCNQWILLLNNSRLIKFPHS